MVKEAAVPILFIRIDGFDPRHSYLQINPWVKRVSF